MIKTFKTKKGFVLMETIIVMSILSLGLISLYTYFVTIQSNTQTVTEDVNSNLYIAYQIYKYKKRIPDSNYIEISHNKDDSESIIQYTCNNCKSNEQIVDNGEEARLYNTLNIEKIYYTNNISSLFNNLNLDGSTLNYLKTIKNDENIKNNTLTIIVKVRNYDNTSSFAYYQE